MDEVLDLSDEGRGTGQVGGDDTDVELAAGKGSVRYKQMWRVAYLDQMAAMQ